MHKIKKYLSRGYVLFCERIPYVHWFNPFATFYLNFRSFPLRQAIKFPVFVYGRPRFFSLSGRMICGGARCTSGMIKINQTNVGAPGNHTTNMNIVNSGTIVFEGRADLYTSSKIQVGCNGKLIIGDDVRIMCGCNISAQKEIKIGEQSLIAHRAQIMDSNFHYILNTETGVVHRRESKIKIGKFCWICNSCTISAGASIPDQTIVSSNSLVNKDFSKEPQCSIIGGIPAKLIRIGMQRIIDNKQIKEIQKFFDENPEINSICLKKINNENECKI